MCVAANDKEHVFSIFHNFTETPIPSATHCQPTSSTPTIGNDKVCVAANDKSMYYNFTETPSPSANHCQPTSTPTVGNDKAFQCV